MRIKKIIADSMIALAATVETYGAAMAQYGIPPKYHGTWCQVGQNKIEQRFKLCRNLPNADMTKSMTVTADQAGQCKMIGNMPYFEGPFETWVVHFQCRDSRSTQKFWRDDQSLRGQRTGAEPVLVMRDITNGRIDNAFREGDRIGNAYAEPPP